MISGKKHKHAGECPETSGGYCRLCDLIRTDPKYHAALVVVPSTVPNRKYPCIHFGADTGETAQCAEGCGKGMHLKVFDCATFGKCTIEKYAEGVPGRCRDCKSRVAPEPVQFSVSAAGIGDHMMGLSVAAAYKEANPNTILHFIARHEQWVKLFADYDNLSLNFVQDAKVIYPELSQRGGLHYVEAVARVPKEQRKIPKLKPLSNEALQFAKRYANSVILAPITLAPGASRDWLLSHWKVLESHITKLGIRTVIIAGGTDKYKLKGFKGDLLLGEPAENVAALMKSAIAVVSNESGMAHLAGALEVPCIVLAAQFDGEHIHGFWPKTKVIQGPLGCGKCRWGGPNYKIACATHCACLQAITPEMVMEKLLPLILESDVSYVNNPEIDSWLKTQISRLCVPAAAQDSPKQQADRRSTMKLFLRMLSGKINPLVVETGCQRQANDYGAGMSTTIIGVFLKAHGGRLISVDNSPKNVAFCRSLVRELPVEVVEHNSLNWLCENELPIDALFLDSLDTTEPRHQEHCLEECQHAIKSLKKDAVVLIDDTAKIDQRRWWGKGARAVGFMQAQGWQLIHSEYQALLG